MTTIIPTSFEPSGTCKPDGKCITVITPKPHQKPHQSPKIKYISYTINDKTISIKNFAKRQYSNYIIVVSFKGDQKYNEKIQKAKQNWLKNIKITFNNIEWKYIKSFCTKEIQEKNADYKNDLRFFKKKTNDAGNPFKKTIITEWKQQDNNSLTINHLLYNLYNICWNDGGQRYELFKKLRENREIEGDKITLNKTSSGKSFKRSYGLDIVFKNDKDVDKAKIYFVYNENAEVFENDGIITYKIIKHTEEDSDDKYKKLLKEKFYLLSGENCKNWVDDLLKMNLLMKNITFKYDKDFVNSVQYKLYKKRRESILNLYNQKSNDIEEIDKSEPKTDKEIAEVLRTGQIWFNGFSGKVEEDTINNSEVLDEIFTKPSYGKM